MSEMGMHVTRIEGRKQLSALIGEARGVSLLSFPASSCLFTSLEVFQSKSCDTIAMATYSAKYVHTIKGCQGAYWTLSQLKEKSSMTTKANVVGVVREIKSQDGQKILTVNDPTLLPGLVIAFEEDDFSPHHVELGDIVVFGEVHRSIPSSTNPFAKLSNFRVSQEKIHLWKTFDEEEEDFDESETGDNLQNSDMKTLGLIILSFLERWQAERIISHSLSIEVKATHLFKVYIDFMGKVLSKKYMKASLVITIWDGTTPPIPTIDPYAPEYANPQAEDQAFELNVLAFCNEQSVCINVWDIAEGQVDRESGLTSGQVPHYNACDSFNVYSNDFLTFFNVELSKLKNDPSQFCLHMRSGLHKARGVRLVSGKSVLGKKFNQTLHDRMIGRLKDLLRKNLSPEEPDQVFRLKELLSKLPPHTDIQTILDRPLAELKLTKKKISDIDLNSISEDNIVDFGELNKDEYVELYDNLIGLRRLTSTEDEDISEETSTNNGDDGDSFLDELEDLITDDESTNHD